MRGPWDAFRRAALDTCEPDVAGWIVHPAETVTALAYLATALLIWTTDRPRDSLLPVGRMPAMMTIVGLASMLFHASFAAVFQQLDLAAIFLVTGLLLAASLVSRGYVAPHAFPRTAVALAGGGSLLPFVHLWLGFAGLALQAAAVLLLFGRDETRRSAPGAYRAAIGLLLPGVALLVLDHAGVACLGGRLAHVVQPHAIWHVLSAAALFFVHRVERHVERQWTGTAAVGPRS